LVSAILFIADARIHLVYLAVYTLVFLFLNLNVGRFYKSLFTSIFAIIIIYIFRSTFSGMISEIVTAADDGLPNSFGLRFELWKAGISIVQDAPLMGIGFESKMPEVIKLLPDHLSYIQFTHLHNMFIDAAVAMGASALFLMSGVFIATFFMLSALEGDMRRRGYAFLTMCIVHGGLGPLFTHDIVASVFIVVLAIFGSCLRPLPAPSD
jgi:O-antigen ligase